MTAPTSMSEFTKAKIGFAIALLAVLFTITPLVNVVGDHGFKFIVPLTIRGLYYFFTAAMALSVYLSAVQFMVEKPIKYVEPAANACYTVAIVAPPAFLGLYFASRLAALAGEYLHSPVASSIAATLLGSAAGYYIVDATRFLQRSLNRGERKSKSEASQRVELDLLQRAESLVGSGHFDIASFEAFKVIEIAVDRKSLDLSLTRGSFDKRWEQLNMLLDIPKDLGKKVSASRALRNSAAHSKGRISKDDAVEAIRTSEKVLLALNDAKPKACPKCGKGEVRVTRDTDEWGTWTEARCSACGWKDFPVW